MQGNMGRYAMERYNAMIMVLCDYGIMWLGYYVIRVLCDAEGSESIVYKCK